MNHIALISFALQYTHTNNMIKLNNIYYKFKRAKNMQKSNILAYFMIATSIISFSLSGAQAPKEREILNFTKELARQHEEELYNILSAKRQEENIKAEVKRIAKQKEENAQRSFKKKSSEDQKFC